MSRLEKMVADHYAAEHPRARRPRSIDIKRRSRTSAEASAAPSADGSNPRAGKTPKLTLKLVDHRISILLEVSGRLKEEIQHEADRIDSVEVALARVERIVQTINQQRHPNSLPIAVQEREQARNLVRRWVRQQEATRQPVPEFVRTLSESWLSVRPGLTRSELRS